MKKRFAPRKSVPSFFMFATIFVAVSIPLVVIGLSGEDSFDTRNKAYEEGSPTATNPCIIYFPKVNPDTLEVNGTYTVSVEAISPVKDIQAVTILDDSGEVLFEKEYTSLQASVEESFLYTPTQTGSNFIRGSITKVTGETACSGESLTVITQNSAPQITSQEKNVDLELGTEFEYTITAEDADKDIINYTYSFTPRADWLKKVVIEDGSDGTVKIKLQGTPDKPASYLAHIFVHDGYGNHLESVSWIINVSQGENDIPIIKVLNPSEETSANAGENIYTKWLASDLNQIVKYQIYISKDPADADTWEPIDENISYKLREYDVNTSGLSGGIYHLIIRAVDNQNPAGIGFAVSPKITIEGKGEEPGDEVILAKPQIINVTPNNSSEVENTKPIIRATLIAGEEATVVEESISFHMNDTEISEGIRLNKISEREFTFIYQPENDLNSGVQKINLSFKDSKENTAEKEWTFTIIDTTPEENDTDIIKIFGIELNKKTALILGAGIAVVLLAILIPVIIYNMWSKKSPASDKIVNKDLPPKMPKSGGMYDLKQSVNTKQPEEIPTETVTKIEPSPMKFSSPSLDDLEKEVKDVPVQAEVENPSVAEEKKIEEKSVIEEMPDTWSPKMVSEEKENEVVQEEKPEPSIPPLPDLAVPAPEVFTDQQAVETPVSGEKSIDEITKLYEEIQKVEENDTTPAQNS